MAKHKTEMKSFVLKVDMIPSMANLELDKLLTSTEHLAEGSI